MSGGRYHCKAPNENLTWARYAAVAVGIHAAVLCLPISHKVPETEKEQIIEVAVVKQETTRPPLLRLREKKLAPIPPAPQQVAPAVREQPLIQQTAKPVEKKEEPMPAGAGNLLDEQVVSRPSAGPSQSNREGVGIAGANVAGGKVGIGSGGTGSGTVAGGHGNGTGTGSGSGRSGGGGEDGSGGPVEARFGEVDGPRISHYEIPEYPPAAKRRGKDGKVVLMVTIDEEGRPTKVDVVEATDNVFARSAVEALRKSTFLPAKRKGVPVACRASLPVRFAMQE